MPDITMCRNKFCEKRDKCYRQQARPSEYMQSYLYFDTESVEKDFADGCTMFWTMQNGE